MDRAGSREPAPEATHVRLHRMEEDISCRAFPDPSLHRQCRHSSRPPGQLTIPRDETVPRSILWRNSHP